MVTTKPPKAFLRLLKRLDKILKEKEQLVICGGMALVLAFGSNRSTADIDIIAPVPFSNYLKEAIRQVAKQTGADPAWLNDASKGFGGYLPIGWEQRLIKIDLGLKNLILFSLGKVDLLMLKLKAARPKDMEDIRHLGVVQHDADVILKNLERITRFDPKAALTIKLILEEWGFVAKSS